MTNRVILKYAGCRALGPPAPVSAAGHAREVSRVRVWVPAAAELLSLTPARP